MSSLTNRLGGEAPFQTVSVRSLQSLRHDNSITSIDVLKTDAECHDCEVIESAGPYLDTEVLAVQCEFSMNGSGNEPPFRSYDALLSGKCFKLFGMASMRGSSGEIDGGNMLYLRSIFEVVKHANARTMGLKLFTIAIALSNLNLAYVIARAMGDASVLTDAESKQLTDFSLTYTYIPDAYRSSPIRNRLAALLGNISHIVVGQHWRGVSSIEANRLHNYDRLIVKRAMPPDLYEAYYQENDSFGNRL